MSMLLMAGELNGFAPDGVDWMEPYRPSGMMMDGRLVHQGHLWEGLRYRCLKIGESNGDQH